jgi:CheY-like chemotaxis protein
MDSARTKRRILVVDDDEDLRETICDALALAGHDTVGVADGRAALTLLRARRFELIVTDLRMPGMNGWELLAALQADGRLRRIPVCVISAEADVPARATRCIRKPFELVSIVQLIDEVFARASEHRCAA